MAIVANEPEADRCVAALQKNEDVAISAATVAEALIVALMRGVGDDMRRLLHGFGFEIVAVTPSAAQRVADAYRRWGKGRHRAGLNLGDCFAYALAEERGIPLLFVGEDFGRTDLSAA